MMCFKDMTFCSAVCGNFTCYRKWTPELQKQAEKWWSDMEGSPPVAFSDFTENCEWYKEPTL